MVSAVHHCILCFLLLFLLSLPIFTVAQTYQNISLGSSLSASNDNSSWISPSGDFAFGFQPMENSGFLLALWFNNIPEKTIVWSANGKNLVQRGSKVELTRDGQLVLNNPQGEEIWRAELMGSGVAYAAMLDTGNLVLVDRTSVNIWASFDNPTDTILPTQILNRQSRLVARQTESNYSSGRFQLRLQPDGNLALYSIAFPTDGVYNAYWASMTLQTGLQVIFNQSGYIYLTTTNGSIFNLTPASAVSTSDFYQRATLDYDGVFRQYVYPKANHARNGGWPLSWSTVLNMPSNICMKIMGVTGSGACGFNSYCRLDENQRPNCECPQGYTYLDPNNKLNGCKQNFISQSCEEGSQETSQFDMKEMPNTDWPESDFELYQSVNENWCRGACLNDCFCAVAIFRDGNCWKKKLPLSNGRIDPSVGGKALIKVRKGNPLPSPITSEKKDRSTLILTGSLLLGSSVFLNFIALLSIFLFTSCSYRKKSQKLDPGQITTSGMNLRSFKYKELEKVTDQFKEELGSGAFATVYKGVLAPDGENLVAVKKLDKVKESDQEFKAEVNAIGRTNHKNLVQLLGFCNDGPHRLLVYEFMSNGSLASFLFGSSRPKWYQRIQIAFGIARGLTYLHEECSIQIIHCDIKPQNILLDDSFTARISDFGLAKLLKSDQSRTSTGIRGTKGYVAPEWFKNMAITVKVDVYSFGILLFEIISCRKNIEADLEDENKVILMDWAYDCFKEGRLDMLVESDDEAMDDMKRLEKLVMIAIWCIQEEPSLRPTMKKVTQMMEGSIEVSLPPDPSSFISSIG